MADPLPDFDADQFALADPPECDLIMKGGITSGIVYPYAILELATKYRFRSVGGTSAGAIAAAFAAAAEYSRTRRGDPSGFVRLKSWCDGLPAELLSLFQPDPALAAATELGRRSIKAGGWRPLLQALLRPAVIGGALTALVLGSLVYLLSDNSLATLFAVLLGFTLGALGSAWRTGRKTMVAPIIQVLTDLPARMFGFCSGLTMPGSGSPGLTDWLHAALQDIAFGPDGSDEILTFGHLARGTAMKPSIDLRMVTTNLSLMRPHTLPDFGMQAGFDPEEWKQLFPTDVLDHLLRVSKSWKGMRRMPRGDDLPVIVATRMSLSFPFLFKAIPVHAEDYEAFRIARALGGRPERAVRRMWLSDGGISSNFPIHLFDAALPTRPTFAFSLDELSPSFGEVERRVMLPSDSTTGLGLPITDIPSLPKFAAQVIWSAKDWQDQLLAGITGQRERIAHIYLAKDEGGLNLGMSPESSRRLMAHGLEAGRLFATQFSFDEHRWRRLLAFYKNTTGYIDGAGAVWNGGYHDWFRGYASRVSSYRLSGRSKNRLRVAVDVLLVPAPPERRLSPSIVRRQLPQRTGVLRSIPRY